MAKPGLKKEAIEQAAIELFACKGLAGTTIKDIAAKAGVTEGALYRHYARKEDMAAALFTRELGKVREELLQVIQPGLPARRNLRAIVAYLYAAYARAPYPLLFVILNFQNLQGSELLDEKEHIYDFIIEQTSHIMGAFPGAQGGEFTATLITGVIIQPILFHHYGKLPQPPDAYVDDVTLACCRLTGLNHEE